MSKEGCHRAVSTPTYVLLAAKGPCVSSAFQALQIATSSVAEAIWCGSGVLVDGKTERSGAEVADSLISLDRSLWACMEGGLSPR